MRPSHRLLTAALFLYSFSECFAQKPGAESLPLLAGHEAGTPKKIATIAKPIRFHKFHSEAVKFDMPVFFGPIPGQEDQFLVLEHRKGKAWRLHKSSTVEEKELFLDLHDQVIDGPWEGLVCVAFHPKFTENRRYFVKHETLFEGKRHTQVVERRARADGLADSGEASRVLLRIKQPADNHNGGTLLFGPDAFLYIAMGDGGPQEDPNGFSQSGTSLLGKMLRIDVDTRSEDLPYGIPKDNPFVGQDPAQMRHEIWAFGLREPWRFSFDSVTNDLWVADVGLVRYEELTIVRAGENHGWNVYETFFPFSAQYHKEGNHYIPPVLSLRREHGVSITGGYVYRAEPTSSFHGVYVFGDYASQRIWGLKQEGRVLKELWQIGSAPAPVTSFGQDTKGRLYLVGYNGFIYSMDFGQSEFAGLPATP